jgi:hypothetical protein
MTLFVYSYSLCFNIFIKIVRVTSVEKKTRVVFSTFYHFMQVRTCAFAW